MLPTGYIEDDMLVHEIEFPGFDHEEKLKQEVKQNRELLSQHITWMNNDLSVLIESLPKKLQLVIRIRRHQILKRREAGSSLDIPLEEDNTSVVYGQTMEEYREVILQPEHRDPKEPVPIVEFDGILSMIEHVGRHCEKYPSMTEKWGEDDFRDNILGYLNIPYRGRATGETFIKGGRSDILITDNDTEVFISENKMWHGQAQIIKEANQLFQRYKTWRGTKAALIYFNRGSNTTDVVRQLREVLATHPQYVETLADKGETHLRFRFSHESDPERIFDLAVLIFPI